MATISEVINFIEFVKARPDGEQFLRNLGGELCELYDDDDNSRKQWLENIANDIKLFNAFLEVKNEPWENASNIVLPMLSIACLQFQARAYDALIPAKNVVQGYATGPSDVEKADRISKHMNYQLLYQMEEFEEGMDKSLLQLPIIGCIFRKTFFDPIAGRIRSDYVSSEDIVVSYNSKVSIEEVKRKTHDLWMDQNDLRIRVQNGMFDKTAWNFGSGSLAYGRGIIAEKENEGRGLKAPVDSKYTPRKILEMHVWVDINADGIEEPFVITVDYETKTIIRMTDRRFTNWKGKEVVAEYFTKYDFIPNPEGFYGIGFGSLHRGLNEAGNTIVNEVIDAGSLANLQAGFVSKRSATKKGSLTFKMGEFKEVDMYSDDIRKSIYQLDFKGPNNTLYAVLGLLYEYSKLVSSVSETMTGQLPASDTPASTVMAIIEEGRKVFSTIHKRIHRAFKKELRKIFRLNSVFLNPVEYFQILDNNNTPIGEMREIAISDYSDEIDVIPVSDPNITSRVEKVYKAQLLVQDVRSNPLTAQNPEANYLATKAYYESLEMNMTGISIEQILKPPPPPPDLAPEDENALFITVKPSVVYPHQNHDRHMQVHQDLLEGVFADSLIPDTVKLVEGHQREHLAQVYLQRSKNPNQSIIPPYKEDATQGGEV